MSNQSERLYYIDSYLTSFRASVVQGGVRAILDRSAFYPSSGGQPQDAGRIGGQAVLDVIEEDGRVIHVLAGPVAPGEVDCEIDWKRRFDHMQQHTGQHLLSAVFEELFGIATVSFHMGAASSTIDLACPALNQDQIEAAEQRANAIVFENRPVSVSFEDAASAAGLRKPSERGGVLRIVSIANLDRSACGGTHVRSTGEIGMILLRSTEKIRGNVRLEFLCGARAVRRARLDFSAMEAVSRLFSAPIDETPELVAAQADKLKQSEKTRQRIESELAEHRGRALHAATKPNGQGVRIHMRVLPGAFPGDLRAEANAYVSCGKAVFIAAGEHPPALLIASAADSGVRAGNLLKELIAECGGKGGGSAQMAQGSFTSDSDTVMERLRTRVSAE